MSVYYNMKNVPDHVDENKRNMAFKEFWVVDGSQNNIRELQEVLDIYFNDYENCYVAEVAYSQNTSRLVVKCNLCNAILSSFDPFVSHNNGKSHKKLVNQAFCKKDNTPPIVRFKTADEFENPFEKGTLEYDIFTTKHDVIGFQFMYREVFTKGERFTCQLCRAKTLRQKQAFIHITSDDHIIKYLKVKFNINAKNLSQSEFQQYIEDVRNKEGRLHSRLYTIECIDEEVRPSSRMKELSLSHKDSNSRGSSVRSPSPELQITPDPKMEKIDDFMSVTSDHLKHIIKHGGDNVTVELQKDVEAVDLLVGTAQVLSQKIYLYSLEDGNRGYEADAKALLNKAQQLKPVLEDRQNKRDEINIEPL